MKISVLISVYKSEKPAYLDRALQSVWDDQTLRPDEIVLIKDGPLGDDLSQVIDKWHSKLGDNLVILSNETNLGLTKSLNRGLKVVQGEYLARMDSDDISTPDRFKLQTEYLDSHPDIAVVGGALQEFDNENECLNVRHYPQTNEDVIKYIYKASPLAHPTVMMRKSIFTNGLSYNEQFRTSQDIALWFDVLVSGYKIGNIDDVTIKFRRDGDVFKRRSREKAKNELKIYLNGIHRLYGLITWRYVFPLARFCFRMMPVKIVKAIYGSKLRKAILN